MPRNHERFAGAAADIAPVDDRTRDAAAAEWFARRDAGLTPAQETEFHRWLEIDPRNDASFARLDSAWSAFGKPVRTGSMNELLQELATRAVRRRRRRVGVAASLVFLLVIGFSWRFSYQAVPAKASFQPTASVLVPAHRVLPDGSMVELKDGAQIAVEFTPALRRVVLQRGEAMFSVAKNPARPFVVSAGGIEVRAVGTAFSVELGRKQLAVLVTEGRVSVDKEAAAAGATPPGEATAVGSSRMLATVDAGNGVVVYLGSHVSPILSQVPAAELAERLAWRRPRVEFSGTPLAEAIALLNRQAASQSSVRLIISDDSLASMRVSGIFRADNTDAFVLLLEASFGIKAERSGNAILLHRAL